MRHQNRHRVLPCLRQQVGEVLRGEVLELVGVQVERPALVRGQFLARQGSREDVAHKHGPKQRGGLFAQQSSIERHQHNSTGVHKLTHAHALLRAALANNRPDHVVAQEGIGFVEERYLAIYFREQAAIEAQLTAQRATVQLPSTRRVRRLDAKAG